MNSAQPNPFPDRTEPDGGSRLPQKELFIIAFIVLAATQAMAWREVRQHEKENLAYGVVYRAYLEDSMADIGRVDNALTTQVQKDVFEGYKTCLGTYLASRKPFPYDKDFVCTPAAIDRVTKAEPAQAKAFEEALNLYRMQYETTLAKHPALFLSMRCLAAEPSDSCRESHRAVAR